VIPLRAMLGLGAQHCPKLLARHSGALVCRFFSHSTGLFTQDLAAAHQKIQDSGACSGPGNQTLSRGKWKITIFNGKIHYKWPFSIANC
jgi:hypothetical protein